MLQQVFRVSSMIWTGFWDVIGFILTQIFFVIVMAFTTAFALIRVVWRVLDKVIYFVERVVLIGSLSAMVLAVFTIALDRWLPFIDLGWSWGVRMATSLMIVSGFLGASIATKQRKHLAIDVAGKATTFTGKKVSGFFASTFTAGFCFVLAWYCLEDTKFSWDMQYGIEGTGGALPKALNDFLASIHPNIVAARMIPQWMVKAVMPFSLIVMGCRAFANIWRDPQEVEDLAEEGKRPDPRALRTVIGRDMAIKDVILAGVLPGVIIGAALLYGFESVGWLIFIMALVLMIVGAPLYVVVGIAVLLCVKLMGNGLPVTVADNMFGAVKKDVLLAIPFFVLAGGIMTSGSIAQRLIRFAQSLIGFVPGGVAVSTVVACMLFAAISGSAPVTVVAIGGIMFPAMVALKYKEDFSLGLVTSAGTLGILIPPSIPMIIYAIMAPVDGRALSIRELFIAGVIPGVTVGLVLAVYSMIAADPEGRSRQKFQFEEVKAAFKSGVWSLILILLIFVGIYSGWFTVVEASAVAVLYALFVEFVFHREMTFKKLVESFVDSGAMMGVLFAILVLAIAFNLYLTEEQIPQAAATWLSESVSTKIGFLILCNLFLLALGCIMDIMSAIMIVAPLLAPIARHYGIDPIHFGIIFIVNLQIGYITPPMGLNLFVSSAHFDRPLGQVIKASFPYIFVLLVALIAVTYVPWLSLALLDRDEEEEATEETSATDGGEVDEEDATPALKPFVMPKPKGDDDSAETESETESEAETETETETEAEAESETEAEDPDDALEPAIKPFVPPKPKAEEAAAPAGGG